jgi:hypothetical protein
LALALAMVRRREGSANTSETGWLLTLLSNNSVKEKVANALQKIGTECYSIVVSF